MLNAPIRFTPLLKTRVWGGDSLKSRAPGAPEGPVGESWELADHGEDTTVVCEGPGAGRSLHDLFSEETGMLAGLAVDPASPLVFPLMLKLIDPRDELSVQVHPNDEYAGRQKSGELGKTEAWYVLEADPGAKIYRGLKEGVTREQFAHALQDGTVADLLHPVEVKPGDVVFLPSGTIHALGAGVRIAEIQQNSDTTYRVFDWNRVGLDGKPRELHIDHALAVSSFEGGDDPDVCPAEMMATPNCLHEQYIECEKFALEKMSEFMGPPVLLDTEGARFHILTVVEGQAEVKTDGGTMTLGRWDSCLVPAGAGEYEVTAPADAAVLLFYRP